MAVVENADLKLTLTIYSDEEKDLVIMLHEVAKKIKLGRLASNYGGCLGSYQYEVVELVRDAQLRIGADDAGQPCPCCGGSGEIQIDVTPERCPDCNGTGQV